MTNTVAIPAARFSIRRSTNAVSHPPRRGPPTIDRRRGSRIRPTTRRYGSSLASAVAQRRRVVLIEASRPTTAQAAGVERRLLRRKMRSATRAQGAWRLEHRVNHARGQPERRKVINCRTITSLATTISTRTTAGSISTKNNVVGRSREKAAPRAAAPRNEPRASSCDDRESGGRRRGARRRRRPKSLAGRRKATGGAIVRHARECEPQVGTRPTSSMCSGCDKLLLRLFGRELWQTQSCSNGLLARMRRIAKDSFRVKFILVII